MKTIEYTQYGGGETVFHFPKGTRSKMAEVVYDLDLLSTILVYGDNDDVLKHTLEFSDNSSAGVCGHPKEAEIIEGIKEIYNGTVLFKLISIKDFINKYSKSKL